MTRIRSVCVFCGANSGFDPAFALTARATGALLAKTQTTLVYGGGNVGLMGELAESALTAGGKVIGVIPRWLVECEVAHQGLTELHIVDTMHERKAMMASLADAFIALPGGLGTLEEIFEIWTWAQLGMHEKPCGFLDVGGFYSPLFAFLDHAVSAGFVRPESRALAIVDDHLETLLRRLGAYKSPLGEKSVVRREA